MFQRDMPKSDNSGKLEELRLYRELSRRRDDTIRALARGGVSPGRIAGAAGISLTQVRRIIRTKF